MVLRARLHRAGLVLAATVAGVITLAGCRTGELIARADETGHPVIAQTSEDETLDFAPASGRTLPLETTPSGAYRPLSRSAAVSTVAVS